MAHLLEGRMVGVGGAARHVRLVPKLSREPPLF